MIFISTAYVNVLSFRKYFIILLEISKFPFCKVNYNFVYPVSEHLRTVEHQVTAFPEKTRITLLCNLLQHLVQINTELLFSTYW